ncbi:hypothetical protein O3M35_007921 [Rhynocoris fuscipes]|uniref:Uncharacterized protein n=1 Tax=Rhynocoris fuscipes TaxID=488301 RepID=A0AAW1DDL6_9HEMI
MFKLFAVCVLLVAVEAIEYGHQQAGGHEGYHEQDYYTEPHYSFVYEVKDTHTHDIKSHKEERKGDHTQGVYELIEPDGSKRIVQYTVEGKSGFNAVVHREASKHPISAGKGGYSGAGYSSGGGAASGGYSSGGYSSGGYSSGQGASGGYSSGQGASSYSSFSSKGSLGGQSGGGYQGGSQSGGYQAGGLKLSGLKLVQPVALHTISYAHLGGGESNLGGGYKSSESSSYGGGSQSSSSSGGYSSGGSGGYGGDATSSVKINTHGAHISSLTHHIIPEKHHY